MGRLFIEALPGPKVFKCKCCKVDSASPNDIVSKAFFGRFGKANLFRSVVNICLGSDLLRNDPLPADCMLFVTYIVALANKYSVGNMRIKRVKSVKKGCTFSSKRECSRMAGDSIQSFHVIQALV